jgi:hypothetical protein
LLVRRVYDGRKPRELSSYHAAFAGSCLSMLLQKLVPSTARVSGKAHGSGAHSGYFRIGRRHGLEESEDGKDPNFEELICIEVAEYLRAHLGKDQLVLLASSMGSTFGMQIARLRPDMFYAQSRRASAACQSALYFAHEDGMELGFQP